MNDNFCPVLIFLNTKLAKTQGLLNDTNFYSYYFFTTSKPPERKILQPFPSVVKINIIRQFKKMQSNF